MNALCSIKRIFRCCQRETFLPLTNCGQANTDHKPRTFMTWNIQGLFIYMNEEKIMNIVSQLQLMNHVDVICLQEVFDDELKQIIISKMKYTHPYYLLGNTKKRYIVGEDSGLLILSKYPIEFVKEVNLHQSRFPDKFANKSLLYVKVGDLKIMNTHLESSDDPIVSKQQLKLIIDECPFNQCIFMGDLNNAVAYQHLGVRKNNLIRTCDDKILDYILPWNYDDYISVHSTSVPNINLTNVSDHYPLLGQF
jgi:endonuclease/exonuclease/phosphatase family metal-dependent hydrolase